MLPVHQCLGLDTKDLCVTAQYRIALSGGLANSTTNRTLIKRSTMETRICHERTSLSPELLEPWLEWDRFSGPKDS